VRVLVTGGAGFIGTNLARRLAREGHDLLVLDNLSTGREENVLDLVQSGAAKLIKGDVRDKELASAVMKDVEAVVHLAAVISVPYSVSHPEVTNEVNVSGTVNLLKAAVRSGASRFIHVSSCAVYGEAQYLPIDENHPKVPSSPYAASKLRSEAHCQAFHETFGLDTSILRLFNVYGPLQKANQYAGVIVQFGERLRNGDPLTIYGDGKQTRDFVHVFDVVDAIYACLGSKHSSGREYNIGSGDPTSIEELASLMSRLYRVKPTMVRSTPRTGDIRDSQADIRKAKSELGYDPRIKLEEGLNMLRSAQDAIIQANSA
jgi:UDP-glucose 4-epimerase